MTGSITPVQPDYFIYCKMTRKIRPHHQRGIDNLVAAYENDDRFQALIIGGSVAKGLARDDSDVDFMIVATDEEFENRQSVGELFINRRDLTDYPHGFVDGKIINMEYLKAVAIRGNEPTRAAFDGAFAAYSKTDELDGIMKRIGEYPEETRPKKLKTFYCMAFMQNWLMNEADRHGNVYTKIRAASQLALFCGRLILAHNRKFFPYHKWFYDYLKMCSEKPESLLEKMDTLLFVPNLKNAQNLFATVKSFRDWGVSDLEAYDWFMKDVELAWMKNNASLEDW